MSYNLILGVILITCPLLLPFFFNAPNRHSFQLFYFHPISTATFSHNSLPLLMDNLLLINLLASTNYLNKIVFSNLWFQVKTKCSFLELLALQISDIKMVKLNTNYSHSFRNSYQTDTYQMKRQPFDFNKLDW